MKTEEIQVFIDSILNYFSTVSCVDVSVGTPYLVAADNNPSKDFTGIIGVSGDRKGCVYFTAPKIMLHHLLLSLGEQTVELKLIRDLVGEVANTIAGNVREFFGAQFLISVPVVVQGSPDPIQLPKQLKCFVIPISWKSYSADLVMALE